MTQGLAKVWDVLFGWRKNVNFKFGKDSQYVLQIKSRTNYGDGQAAPPKIRVFTTKLWYDPLMTNATPSPTATGG
jgi:hypothetical protein